MKFSGEYRADTQADLECLEQREGGDFSFIVVREWSWVKVPAHIALKEAVHGISYWLAQIWGKGKGEGRDLKSC